MNDDKSIYQDKPNRFVSFDWALSKMLRDKANFGILEGLVTVLLNEKIEIIELLENESNQRSADNKFNRVDIKAKNENGDIILVGIRLTRELHYLEQILSGVKTSEDCIFRGDKLDDVKKVYSINIMYFNIGQGGDYLYHGRDVFTGVHTNDVLRINAKESNVIRMITPEDVSPEYYIIRLKKFERVATTPLEDWIDYLKTNNIRPGTTAPGLEEAREKLQYLSMNKKEREAYYRHISAIMVQNDVIDTAKMEGRAEGFAEGLAEARAERRAEGL
jgi:predicted transposase/invertase (TIGR01784 family)